MDAECSASAARRAPKARVGGHAPAQQHRVQALALGHADDLADLDVHHRLLERGGHVGQVDFGPAARTWRSTAVLRPENEKSSLPSSSSALGNRTAAGSPSRARRSTTGPPG